MSNEKTQHPIQILGKVYHVKCPSTEIPSLERAALYLEEKMRIMRDSGIATDRIAIITALNVVHQLLTLEQQKNSHVQTINQRLYELQNKLDHALAKKYQWEFETEE